MILFPSRKSYVDVLLLHPTEAKVLILSKDNISYLPQIEINKEIERDDFQVIKESIEPVLNIAVNVLHHTNDRVDRKQRTIKDIYILEQQNNTEKVRVGTWCHLQTLENLTFSYPEQKSLIKKYLIELESGNIPQLRSPWAKLGWFSEASAWIEEQLENLEEQKIAPLEYVKNWSLSCILRVKTTRGTIYFKTASTYFPLFCDEPIVTAELASLFPQYIPNVIAIDRQRHWMLLEDFGKPIGRKASLKVQQDIYRLLAQIQIQSIEYRDLLSTVGCLDRRLPILQSQIEPLVNDEEALSELSTAEIDRLQNLVPKLQNLCWQLADYQIPETLVHGDLHLNNVAFYRDNYLFFDWTDTCISHPFFDLLRLFLGSNQKSILGYIGGFQQRKVQQLCRDCYLSQWTQYESNERLLDAWNIAKPLCVLHSGITNQKIISSLESGAKQEFAPFLTYLLRQIIEYGEDF